MKMQRSKQEGIALIEALIATIILAVGLLGTIGLQARALSAMSEASSRSEATMASERLFGLMNTDQVHVASYAMVEGGTPSAALAPWYQETTNAIPGAKPSVTVTPASNGTNSTQVTVTIKWQRKAGDATTANTSTVTSFLSVSS